MKTTIKRRSFALCASTLYILAAGHPVLAEDIEVLVGPGGQTGIIPNVLFIMDTSGSMRRDVAGNSPPEEGPSRLEIVQDVFADLMTNNSGINVALMRFNPNNTGGRFTTPMQVLNTDTRDDIIAASSALTAEADTFTPLAETLYEAALFWQGDTVDYGGAPSPNANVAGVSSNGNYISPISSQCQRNYTILLTDGLPYSDDEADTKITTMTGSSCDAINNNCLDEVARYLNTVDQSAEIDGTQTVETYTIGFTLPARLTQGQRDLLPRTATAGGGRYFPADSASELSDAFAEILETITITDTNNSFSPPALAVNTFSGIAHFNRLYYALFEPAATPRWNGNVKPYTLNGDFELIDANDNIAVDDRGFFLETSRSLWSADANGGNLIEGGANSRFPGNANDRNLYTYTGDYSTFPASGNNDHSNNDDHNDDDDHDNNEDHNNDGDHGNDSARDTRSPSSGSFPLDTLLNDNSNDLTADMLGLSNPDAEALDAEFSNVLDTVRNARLGAPLHSQPVLVTYANRENADNAHLTLNDAVLTLFVATNDGFLHALDASPGAENTPEGGRELFAFIPKELLPNLSKLDDNTGSMVYGLDGDISVWAQESSDDADYNIERGEGDHVYVYVGMRRGGSNYYALDATDREAPTLKWAILGGPDGTPGFEELGQSWSKAALTSIKYGDDTRKVLIFGGGYDTAQDDNPLDADDSIGRAVFIVDAETGERLWWAGPNDADNDADLRLPTLTNSIPSEIRLFDSDHDGNTDRLYVGDMRGQIFRFDLRASDTGITGSGIRLANLGGTDEADNRRFYYPPDVVFTQRRGTAPYISVNIGSGYRAHPLNPLTTDGRAAERVDDRFYSLRDPNVLGVAPDDFEAITHGRSSHERSNLFDATSTLVTSPTDIDALSGWYITLGDGSGEKVLAPSMTINGEIFFTTYTPPASVARGQCEPPSPGEGRLYRVSLFDAAPTRNAAETGGDSDTSTPAPEDRSEVLERPGIPPGPTVIVLDGAINQCVGAKCGEIANPNPIQKTYWQDGADGAS